MAEIPPSWNLTPSQRLSIFTNRILPAELLPHITHTTPSNDNPTTPLAIIILGQTGAGKTRLAPALLTSLTKSTSPSSPSPAHLIADTYKTYHPYYTTCLSQFPRHASLLAGPDARAWLTMAVAHAAAHKIPVLLESACRYPGDFSQLAGIFHSSGYRVLVAILAVPAPVSRLGILVRYYRDLPEARSRGLPVRLTPRRVHDESYAGLEAAAGWVDDGGMVDEVVVVRRGGMLAYSNRRVIKGGGDGWEREAGALKVLLGERERGVLGDEREIARGDIEKLRKLGDEGVDGLVGEIEREIVGLGSGDGDGDGAFPDLELLDVDGFVGGSG